MSNQDRVRYRVLKPCFVNGSRHDPRKAPKGEELIIMAPPGLEGSALQRVDAPKTGGKAKTEAAQG